VKNAIFLYCDRKLILRDAFPGRLLSRLVAGTIQATGCHPFGLWYPEWRPNPAALR
jgi:hypothetical protein